jgi:hypothetical protein
MIAIHPTTSKYPVSLHLSGALILELEAYIAPVGAMTAGGLKAIGTRQIRTSEERIGELRYISAAHR